jgi:hypothetical protein
MTVNDSYEIAKWSEQRWAESKEHGYIFLLASELWLALIVGKNDSVPWLFRCWATNFSKGG